MNGDKLLFGGAFFVASKKKVKLCQGVDFLLDCAGFGYCCGRFGVFWDLCFWAVQLF